jgi:hypothetical protein
VPVKAGALANNRRWLPLLPGSGAAASAVNNRGAMGGVPT